MNQVIVVAKTEAPCMNVISRAFRRIRASVRENHFMRLTAKIHRAGSHGLKTLFLCRSRLAVHVERIVDLSLICFSGPEKSNKKATTIKGEKRDKNDMKRKIIISANKELHNPSMTTTNGVKHEQAERKFSAKVTNHNSIIPSTLIQCPFADNRATIHADDLVSAVG
jgi:hypothetical protein